MTLKKEKYHEGQALFTAVIFFLFISLAVVMGLTASAVKSSKISLDLLSAKKSYFIAESGAEDAVYRVIRGKKYSEEEVVNLDGLFATTTIVMTGSDITVESTGNVSENVRKTRELLSNDSGISFHYGVQVGNGGLEMENSSGIVGNVYSNGLIEGAGSNLIKGDAVSAGASGSISGVHATSSAYAHNISNSTIDKDAYFQAISDTTVKGTLYPGSPDEPLRDMPISDETINSWEQAATVNVVSSPCPYIINSDVTLGPVKITCDLTIKGSPTVTLAGPIWVVGDITVENSTVIRLDSSLGKKSIAVIADDPLNRNTGSKIDLKNSVTFYNSGTKGSYVLFISQNNSTEVGGEESAITIQNSANGDVLLYACHSEILLANSINLREVTAYKVHLKNSAQVLYESGLASILFETGPSGGYSIDSWREVK